MKTIQESVAEKISKSGENVTNIVIEKLAEVEISKRIDIIIKSVQKLDLLEKEFKKIDGKNDNITYVGGEKVESMTEKRFNEIKKAKENISNLKSSIDNALEKNTEEFYNKLNGIINSGNKEQGTGETK